MSLTTDRSSDLASQRYIRVIEGNDNIVHGEMWTLGAYTTNKLLVKCKDGGEEFGGRVT